MIGHVDGGSEAEQCWSKPRVRHRPPKPGGWRFFSDPRRTALEAPVFWHPDAIAPLLSARVRKAPDPGPENVVRIDTVPCRKAVLRIAGTAQYLVLADAWRAVQMRCEDADTGADIAADIGAEPFALEIVLDRFPDVESTLRLARIVADLWRGRPPPKRLREGSVEGLRHRDAIAALDRGMEGWSYREIAVFLHGEAEVRRRWNEPDRTLKNRVIRSVKRGTRMMEGGYRSLLR